MESLCVNSFSILLFFWAIGKFFVIYKGSQSVGQKGEFSLVRRPFLFLINNLKLAWSLSRVSPEFPTADDHAGAPHQIDNCALP